MRQSGHILLLLVSRSEKRNLNTANVGNTSTIDVSGRAVAK